MHTNRQAYTGALLAVLSFFLTAFLVQAGPVSVRVFEPSGASCTVEVTVVAYDSANRSLGTWKTTGNAVTILPPASTQQDKSIKLTFQRANSPAPNLTLTGIYMDFTPATPPKTMEVIVP